MTPRAGTNSAIGILGISIPQAKNDTLRCLNLLLEE
jgi:hypothetical protein